MTRLRGVIVEGTRATLSCVQVPFIAFSMLDPQRLHSSYAPCDLDDVLNRPYMGSERRSGGICVCT